MITQTESNETPAQTEDWINGRKAERQTENKIPLYDAALVYVTPSKKEYHWPGCRCMQLRSVSFYNSSMVLCLYEFIISVPNGSDGHKDSQFPEYKLQQWQWDFPDDAPIRNEFHDRRLHCFLAFIGAGGVKAAAAIVYIVQVYNYAVICSASPAE